MASGRVPENQARILCIDDDPYLTDLLRYALTREGYRVSTAPSRAGVLPSLRSEPYDLVLLDMHTSSASSYALCSSYSPADRGPASYRTEHVDLYLAGFAYQAVGFLAKPFSLWTLLDRVSAALVSSSSPEADARPFGPAGNLVAFASVPLSISAGRFLAS